MVLQSPDLNFTELHIFQIWSSLFKVGTSLAGAAGRNFEPCFDHPKVEDPPAPLRDVC